MKRLTNNLKKKAAIVDFDLLDTLREYLDDTTILEELVRALDTYTVKEYLGDIANDYDILLNNEVTASKKLQKTAYIADDLEEIYDDAIKAINDGEDLYAALDNGEVNEWAYRVEIKNNNIAITVYKYDIEGEAVSNYVNVDKLPSTFEEFEKLINNLCYYAF